MTTGPSNDTDLDRTDELPVLSEEAAVDYRLRDANFDDDPLSATGEHDTTAIHKLATGLIDAADSTTAGRSGPAPDIERLERDIEALSTRWRDVESLLASNSTALSDLQVELSESRRELRESHQRQQSLLAELNERNTERNELRRQLAAAEASSSSAGKEVGQARSRIGELESALAASRDEVAALQADLEQARARIVALDDSLESTLAAKSALESERENLSRELIETIAARDEAAAAAAALAEATPTGSGAAGSAADTAVSGLNDDATGHISGTTGLLEKIAGLESYIAGRKDRWADMEATISDRDRRIVELEQELAYRVNQQEALEQQIATEQTIAAELRVKLEESQRALERRLAADTAPPDGHAPAPAESRSDAVTSLEQRIDEAKARLKDLEGTMEADAETPNGSAAPALICLTNDAAPRHEITQDELTIGRGAECDIRIPTHFVSRLHAVLQRKGNEITIADRGSTNGVFVNSLRVDQAVLHEGDWVTIGETQFRFVANGAAYE